MVWMTVEQFCALSKKCSHCEKKAKWVASEDSPAYCDEHFPYYDVTNIHASVEEPKED